MRCPECQTELPIDAKFCNECGRKLESVCSECGKGNPPASKFCLECGHDLRAPSSETLPKDLSFHEKLAKIQRFLPEGLSEKILSQRDKIEGERRQVTIMFVDMKGFTPLTEKLGPEETFSLMDQVYEIMIHKVHEYEGTVNELRGDGILALFGAPVALEDAPQRAIRSSLAMHREMVKFSDKIKAEKSLTPIMVRIGINTGPVVVGTLGNDLRVQFTAVGDTINMAARMEQIAEPGTTYVTVDTFKLTEGFFRFEALGERVIKGKEKPMRVYRVLAPSSRKTRFDVSAERGLTRFVGRERELEILMDAFERAKAGRGQAVSIMGEAGVGKSRLLYEFRKAIANEDITFLEGKCLSYSRAVAYHPIIDIFKANFGIEDNYSDSDVIDKVTRGLTIIGADEASTLPYLLELFSVEKSGIDKIQMSPEGKKDRIISAIQRIVLKSSEIRPLIIATEDLHWMDKSSEDASKNILESIPGARVLLISTYRPEFVQTWGAKSYHSHVNLNRLSNRESLAVTRHLLGTDEIATDLEDLILEKSEGVPFFIEELVQSLRDLNLIEEREGKFNLAAGIDQLAIPSTIQDVIMARVDRLPEKPREVLQTGSVIEREFSHELIKAVTGLTEQELLSSFAVLKDSELLYERGIYPECSYVFRHALTREVVYESILKQKKKQLHENVGHSIEELYKDDIHDHYGFLAEHYFKANNWEKAAEYSRLAGKKAAKSASMNDAITHAEKTVISLEKLHRPEDAWKKLIDARAFLGLLYHQISQINEAKQAIEPIIDLAVKHDYRRRLSQIYCLMGASKCWLEEDFEKAFEYLNDTLNIARETGDLVSLVFGNLALAIAMMLNCQYKDALVHFGEMLQINTDQDTLWAVAVTKTFQSICNIFHGKIETGYRDSCEALNLEEQSGDILSKSYAHIIHGMACYGKGYLQEAELYLKQGVALCKRTQLPVYQLLGHWFLGEISTIHRNFNSAESEFMQGWQVLNRFKLLPSWQNLCRLGMMITRLQTDDRDMKMETLNSYVARNRVKMLEGSMRSYLAQVFLNMDNDKSLEAQRWFEQAIEADQRNAMGFHLARDHALYAELFTRKGDRQKAREQLGKAIEIYKECGADGWVTKAEEELGRLS